MYNATAVCPMCAVAVGAGVGLSRCLGIDDSIAGIWIGGLLMALALWALSWARMRSWYTNLIGAGIIISFYAFNATTFGMLVRLHACSFAADAWQKLALGIFAGSVVFYGSTRWYEWLKKRHGGHAYFPFQKIVMPLVGLLITSGIAYWLAR